MSNTLSRLLSASDDQLDILEKLLDKAEELLHSGASQDEIYNVLIKWSEPVHVFDETRAYPVSPSGLRQNDHDHLLKVPTSSYG